VETPIAQRVTDRAKLFPWSDPAVDNYPPHFYIPTGKGKEPEGYSARLGDIFNILGLAQARAMLQQIVPSRFLGGFAKALDEKIKAFLLGDKSKGLTMTDLEGNNQRHRKTATDVMQGKNIGDLEDWWSDARFAQQQFTGTNPVTITVASSRWLTEFTAVATAQSQSTVGKAALEFIQKASPRSLFVQDFSYFREAIGVKPDAPMWNEDRYTVATVSLFHLNEKGILHPISICIDYKGSMDKSVVVFNRSLEPPSEWDRLRKTKLADEKHDWPWRYAKQCAQSADWIRHEIATHLTHTHLIEEAILVAANRTLPIDHVVFRLLEPHWFRTLPLNAAARQTLVPEIIFGLIGMKDKQPLDLIMYFYKNFDFVGGYIPNDLPNRGFPLEDLDHEKHRNYVYAKNMNLMWATIRKFVKSMLTVKYTEDADVANDPYIQSWCRETQEKGQITTFPTIKTVDELIDACTMCIHIASPQHTAVNYLQNFYHVFIPSKPPALWREPPSSLAELMKYTEQDVLKSLPMNRQREWMLATQIPWLLSFKTADEHSLLKYSQQLYNLVRKSEGATDKKTKAIAEVFYDDLRKLVIAFNDNSLAMTRGTVPYVVMDPASTAVSILI
jgi:Lipoxygenase